MTVSIKSPTSTTGSIQLNGSDVLTIDSSGNLTVPNNLTVTGTAPIPDALSTASGSAPSYSARAWVNFNGTGTVAIRASGNVSSITDQGSTGLYAVNFTTAMPDTNYCVAGMKNTTGEIRTGANNVNFVEIRTANSSGTSIDMSEIMVAIFR